MHGIPGPRVGRESINIVENDAIIEQVLINEVRMDTPCAILHTSTIPVYPAPALGLAQGSCHAPPPAALVLVSAQMYGVEAHLGMRANAELADTINKSVHATT